MSKTLFLIMMLASLSFAEEENGTCKDGTDEYCAKCENDKCTKCYGSYSQENGQCKAPATVIEQCLIYKSSSECLTCKVGYYGTSCSVVIISKCLVVDLLDILKCKYCEGENPDSPSSTCNGNACKIENCRSCNGTGDDQTCEICKDDMEPSSDKKSCNEKVKHENGCTTSSNCRECAIGFYVSSSSTSGSVTCKKSSRYESVAILTGAILSWLAFLKF